MEEQLKLIPIKNRMENKIFIQKVMVTPKLATKLLMNMNRNRRVKFNLLNRIVDSLNNNEWECENGETIKITSYGKLFDGQHRLQAVIDSKKDTPMYFTFNCNNNSINTVDTGAHRRLQDILKINNIKYFNTVGGIIQSESVFKKGVATRHSSTNSDIKSYNKILEIALDNKEYLEFVCKTADSLNNKFALITISYYAKYFNILHKIDKETCFDFFKMLSTGKDCYSPIYQLRNVLIKDASKAIRKLNSVEKEALFIKAWNYYVDGKDIKLLKWVNGIEKFPKFKRIELATDLF